MAKILFIGDPHLKITKFDISCKFLNWIGEVVKTTRPDYVINLGDSFDTHSVIRSEILGEFKKHIEQITNLAPYIYILGNHDMYRPNDSKYHALQTLKEMDRFTVVDEPMDLLGITMVPYIHDFKQFPKDTQKIVVAHQTFTGADYGFYRPDLGVDADLVAADIIISGHIHKRQMFGKVIYPGTPFAQNADDVNQSKGVMLFDTDTYKYSFIESPFPKWKSMKFDITQDLTIHEMHESLEEGLTENDNWIVTVEGPKAELAGYMNSSLYLALQQKYSLRFIPKYNDKDKHIKIKIKSSSTDEVICDYVDKVYQGTMNKSELKTKALKVLTKVRLT